MTPDIMPFVHVEGTWGEMGAGVGRMFAPLIERHVDVHANHLEAPEFAGYETAPENSCRSRARLAELLEGAATPLTVADLQRFYRITPMPRTACAPIPLRAGTSRPWPR
jgi:hypothetical protein